MSAEEKLASLGLELPPAPKAIGLYKPVIIVDGLAYTSGHGPLQPDGTFTTGRLGADLDTQAGFQAARQTGLATLATLREALGSLDRVERLVKTVGLVNGTPDFIEQPAVVNGFSELMRDVFGEEAGIAARSAVGVASLPAGWPVEVEAVFAVRPA